MSVSFSESILFYSVTAAVDSTNCSVMYICIVYIVTCELKNALFCLHFVKFYSEGKAVPLQAQRVRGS